MTLGHVIRMSSVINVCTKPDSRALHDLDVAAAWWRKRGIEIFYNDGKFGSANMTMEEMVQASEAYRTRGN